MTDPRTDRSFAVFPFLKTSEPVTIGPYTFRGTQDVSQLPADDALRLQEIADMLFVRDHYRVHTSSYSTLPYVDLSGPSEHLDDLARVQSLVAYAYSSPHPASGSPFLSAEHASLVIVSPDLVAPGLVRAEHGADLVGEEVCPLPADMRFVPGYHGLYNFRHHFWVVRGSRLYGPLPHITLNISQDLAVDIGGKHTRQPTSDLVWALLDHPNTDVARRVFTAITWYNRATTQDVDEEVALVQLATAFEALLALPKGTGVTDRFHDAVALLLGKGQELESWLDQFYAARSQVAHRGVAANLRFAVRDHERAQRDTEFGNTLLSYGRSIFQLCVGTILVGAQLAANARLTERLTTNQERFVALCGVLSDQSVPPMERLLRSAGKIADADRYRFVPETGLQLQSILGCVRLAAECLLDSGSDLPSDIQLRLSNLATAQRSRDHCDQLAALMSLHDAIEAAGVPHGGEEPLAITAQLVDVAHGYTFMHFFWLKGERAGRTRDDAAPNCAADTPACDLS